MSLKSRINRALFELNERHLKLELADFVIPTERWLELFRKTVNYLVFATVLGIISAWLSDFKLAPYFLSGIESSISESTFNVIGFLSLFVVGLCFFFGKLDGLSRLLTQVASWFFLRTFEVGMLILGIPFGKFIYGASSLPLLAWLISHLIALLIMLVALFIIAFTTWYPAYILHNGEASTPLMQRISTWTWRLNTSVGLSSMVMAALMLLFLLR